MTRSLQPVGHHSERHKEKQMTTSSEGVRQGCPARTRGRNVHVRCDPRIVAGPTHRASAAPTSRTRSTEAVVATDADQASSIQPLTCSMSLTGSAPTGVTLRTVTPLSLKAAMRSFT